MNVNRFDATCNRILESESEDNECRSKSVSSLYLRLGELQGYRQMSPLGVCLALR